MKKIILITLTVLFASTAFGQNKSYTKSGSIGNAQQEKPAQKEDKFLYGPVKYRELYETIGEKYIIVPLSKRFASDGYVYLSKSNVFDRDKKLSATEGAGKVLTMMSVSGDDAHFKDSIGNEYVSKIKDGHMFHLASVYDIDEARRLFLGKTLWLNDDKIYTYNDALQEVSYFTGQRFNSVKVVNVIASAAFGAVRFVIENKQKQAGYTDVIVSGTNMNMKYLNDYKFDGTFFTKDPKLTYKFTPAMWAKIKARVTEIDMTEEQVKLSRGFPDKINRSTGAGTADQWIYGESYLYFRNGKLSSIQN